MKKDSLFPVKYKVQEDMAKAFLYTDIDEDDKTEDKLSTLVGREKFLAKYLSAYRYMFKYRNNYDRDNKNKMDSIQFIKKQVVETEKGKGFVYFYKYRAKKDDKWRIAVSGLQPLDGAGFSYKNVYTKFTDEKIKEDEPLDDQLSFQLKKLIFANREGCENFFNDSKNDYLNYRNVVD
jgi:hypothetical protein